MMYFPQIATGAAVQYPVRRRQRFRTVQNTCSDGHTVKLSVPNASTTEWELTYSGLTDEEINSLEQIFAATEGALGSFTFLDPVDNLLCWSEKLDEPAWEKDALITIAGGAPDPLGSFRASRIRNCSPVPLRMVQRLNLPASYFYCVSCHIRADVSAEVSLIRGTERASRWITPKWQRLAFAAQSQSSETTVCFGLELPGNLTADVLGFQVEAQPSASGYKRSGARTGVYENARFRDDEMSTTRLGPDNNCCKIFVIHGEHF
jgi:hypothetical protein